GSGRVRRVRRVSSPSPALAGVRTGVPDAFPLAMPRGSPPLAFSRVGVPVFASCSPAVRVITRASASVVYSVAMRGARFRPQWVHQRLCSSGSPAPLRSKGPSNFHLLGGSLQTPVAALQTVEHLPVCKAAATPRSVAGQAMPYRLFRAFGRVHLRTSPGGPTVHCFRSHLFGLRPFDTPGRGHPFSDFPPRGIASGCRGASSGGACHNTQRIGADCTKDLINSCACCAPCARRTHGAN
ncbi:hypothetical protein KI387_035107, partial [Taxus chinensis]